MVRAPDALAYEKTTSRPDEEFRRKIRIACQAFNVHRLLWPQLRRLPILDQDKYISHKLLRWLTVYFLALAGLCAIVGLALMRNWGLLAAVVAMTSLRHARVGHAIRSHTQACRYSTRLRCNRPRCHALLERRPIPGLDAAFLRPQRTIGQRGMILMALHSAGRSIPALA